MDRLRDALETTNWSALCEPHGEDLDGLTDCVSDYIKFCTENSVPTKKVRCYPNNKPWVTSDLKALLNKKKRAFTAGDPAELRSVQKELKRSVKESKDAYRKKLEERLERNQTRDVWSGMRRITGFQKKGIRSADGNVDQANELNQFFNRWSRENLLQLNVTKTKEMVVDFRKSKSPPSPVCISGKDVEIVPSYRFLGVQLDKLEWSINTDAVHKKAMSRLFPQETQVI
ncbi:hypothetical protein D4764_04G0012550 [Takifugu flavidus]|uniref:Uncharacterized protein n=1 Tax=Takifugu flavidus TaxID=433684 RepID=A0A5C6N783_9TELE|nr:hypothetical protein D4764_04G0012550 [Takifugu flavidus]